MSFSDVVGRSWTWCFIPKDMPFSEWSMEHSLGLRLARLKKTELRQSFESKRDLVLVMSETNLRSNCLLRWHRSSSCCKAILGASRSTFGRASSISTWLSWRSLTRPGWNDIVYLNAFSWAGPFKPTEIGYQCLWSPKHLVDSGTQSASVNQGILQWTKSNAHQAVENGTLHLIYIYFFSPTLP